MIIDNICNITLLLSSCYLAFYQHLSTFSKFWKNYAEFCRISPRLTPWKFFNTPTQKSNFASLGLRGSHLDTCRWRWRPAATPRRRDAASPGEKISKKIFRFNYFFSVFIKRKLFNYWNCNCWRRCICKNKWMANSRQNKIKYRNRKLYPYK